MPLDTGQPVSVPHPKFGLGGERIDATFESKVPDYSIQAPIDGQQEQVPLGRVRYADGTTQDWPLDAIEPI